MNTAVTEYIENLAKKANQEWQVEICNRLRQIALESIADVEERIQYGKPHYLKNGKYACVLGTAKEWVSFMIFKAELLAAPAGLFEPGGTTIKIRKGQVVDYELIRKLLQQAASSV